MSSNQPVLDQITEKLDKVRLGKCVDAFISEMINQFGLDNIQDTITEVLNEGLKDYNPPGPPLTDKAVKNLIRDKAVPAISLVVTMLLKEKYSND